MNKNFMRNRKVRYGGMTALLTVLLITAIVLANAVLGTLAKRYTWYVDMHGESGFGVSENCYTLLGSMLEESGEPVEVIFCDTAENWQADSTQRTLYETAVQIAGRFPEKIRIVNRDIWLNPSMVESFATMLNPATGEMVDTPLKSTNVILHCGDYHRVYTLNEFFVFDGGDTSKVWAYNGEKKLAAGILHAIEPNGKTVCLTNNHGETFYDYELFYLLDDAGYTLGYADLFTGEIPENCSLIVTYNPNTDLTVTDEKSEIDVLNGFLAVSGHSCLVFLENGTPRLPNLETFLSEWGVDTCYTAAGEDERAYRYMVQDPSGSLTSDGYTIYGVGAKEGHAGELLAGATEHAVFKNATGLRAANGYEKQADGSYIKGNRTLYGLFSAGKNAVCWANGQAVDNKPVMLMTVTEQTNADGAVSQVGVVSSVKFAAEDALQSAVFGNTGVLLRLADDFGMKYAPHGLTIKPFQSTDISMITTAQMLRWTLLLALIPAVAVPVIAVVILVRRRNA